MNICICTYIHSNYIDQCVHMFCTCTVLFYRYDTWLYLYRVFSLTYTSLLSFSLSLSCYIIYDIYLSLCCIRTCVKIYSGTCYLGSVGLRGALN